MSSTKSADNTGSWVADGDTKYVNQISVDGEAFTITYNKASSTNFKSPTAYTPWRMYGSTNFVIETETVMMTKVVITMTSGYAQTFTVTPDSNWTGSLSDAVYTATSTGAMNITVENSATKQARISSIVVTGEPVQAAAVKTPKIELVETNSGASVVMSCETEGAEIYYTVGFGETPADPTSSSLKYTDPIELWGGELTYKAIAYVGDECSNVAVKDISAPYVIDDFTNLTDFNQDTKVIVTGDLTAIYQNGDYLWVKDSYNGMLLYGKTDNVLNNGDKISGVRGIYTVYNDQPEIKNFTLGAVSAGTPVEPTPIEVSDVSDYMMNHYVMLSEVSIENQSGATYKVRNADGAEAVLYNKFTNASKYDVVEVPEGEGFTIVGFVCKNQGVCQIIPVSITGGTEMQQVEAPVYNFASGELESGTEITITCATEGATIYYTIDGTTPSADAIEYTGAITFTEAMTLKAIAVKDGMLDSEVVEAVYTLYDPNAPAVYTFDFTNPAKYGIQLPDAGKGTDLCAKEKSVTFTEGVVNLTFKNINASNAPRVWNRNGSYDVRVYAGSEVEFATSTESCKIQKIEFIQNTGATDWGADNTYSPDTFDRSAKVWNGGESDDAQQTFTMTPAAKTFFAKAIVTIKNETGVEGVAVEEAGEAVYYNMQGMRVANPEKGLYIIVKGGKSSKVIL